ncbi:MAG: MFS transporter [Alphaproteobacteria bacterium]|nr:MFS transporter [Alphaproteobacteria bacterium]
MSEAAAPVRAPLFWYYASTGLAFAAIGVQFVLFPYLVTVELALPAPLVGAAQMCTMLPSLLFLLPAGVLADQTDGRRAILLYHMAAALPPLGLAAAIGLDALSFSVLIAYALAMGTLFAFIVPIRDSLLTHLASPARLQQAIGIAVMMQFGVQIIGMAAAGSAKWVGAEPLLLLMSVLMLAGFAAAWQLPSDLHADDAERTRPRRLAEQAEGLREGILAAAASAEIRPVIIAMVGVGFFYVGSFMTVVPLIIRESYAATPLAFSLVSIAFWGGTILSNIALMRIGRLTYPGRAILFALAGGAIVLSLMSNPMPLWLLCSLACVWGMGAGVTITMGRTIVQERARADMRGRMLAIYQMGFSGGGPLGAVTLGFVAAALGPYLAALVPAAMMACVLAYLVTQTRLPYLRAGVEA